MGLALEDCEQLDDRVMSASLITVHPMPNAAPYTWQVTNEAVNIH